MSQVFSTANVMFAEIWNLTHPMLAWQKLFVWRLYKLIMSSSSSSVFALISRTLPLHYKRFSNSLIMTAFCPDIWKGSERLKRWHHKYHSTGAKCFEMDVFQNFKLLLSFLKCNRLFYNFPTSPRKDLETDWWDDVKLACLQFWDSYCREVPRIFASS